MLWISLLLACTDDFKNIEQNITPVDTSENTTDTADTGSRDTADSNTGDDTEEDTDTDTDTEEPIEDYDGDGWTEDEGDCDDNDANINPGVPDNNNDGIDQDCDGIPDDEWEDPQDLDGDGFTVSDGDCLDTEATFNPDALDDECDGLDQNCNQIVDDGFMDQWEPNDTWTFGDTSAINYLGRLDEGDGLIEIYNYHSPENDVDSFAFYNVDGWFWDFNFTITLWDVPSTLDLSVSMEGFDEQGNSFGVVATATGNGPGTTVEFDYEGGSSTDTGYYVITITGVGSDCTTPYQIRLEEN